jgi:hypothetical protein
MQSLPTDDLMVLRDVVDKAMPEREWTDRESAAVKALSCAFELEAQRAGYGSAKDFRSSCGGWPVTLDGKGKNSVAPRRNRDVLKLRSSGNENGRQTDRQA